MENQDFTLTLVTDTSAKVAFDRINEVSKWWTENLEGNSKQVDDEFTVRFGDVHITTHKLVEVIPNKKVVWLTAKSELNFLKDKTEWEGTTVSFEISEKDGKTQIVFTHHGLVPAIECYKDCQKGWTYYIGSLSKFVNEGKGTPDLK